MKPNKAMITLLAIFAAGLIFNVTNAQDIIDPGPDYYIVPDDPASFFEFGGPEIPPIPADFFGPGSDPFDGTISFEGIGSGYPMPDWFDVNITRLFQGNVSPPYPAFAMIDVEIVELRLQSIDPIMVNYQGAYTEFWDVEVQLSQIPSPTGYLDAIKETTEGGIFSYMPLMVQPQFIFTLTTNPSEVRIFDTGLEGVLPLEFHSDVVDYPFMHLYDEFITSATYPMPLFTSSYTNGLYLMPINDWGDALDPPYPTMASSNGAFHPIEENVYLGNAIDSEAGGIPDPDALGDDNDNLPDEDGVLFITPLTPGSNTDIEVIASADGYLYCWIDFDINGDWIDPDDLVFDNMNIAAGMNLLTFTVPSSAM